jgi:hypothetical protein
MYDPDRMKIVDLIWAEDCNALAHNTIMATSPIIDTRMCLDSMVILHWMFAMHMVPLMPNRESTTLHIRLKNEN